MNINQEKILENLNPRQLEAVQSIENSTLVIAGAGSGKTAVLARRVAYLIAKGEIPGRILCLTFTNKASKEMNDRVKKLLDSAGMALPDIKPWITDYYQIPTICTFHSLGVKILREFGNRVNLKSEFSILDRDDQKKIIKQAFGELNIDKTKINANNILYFISLCKQEMLTADKSHKLSKDFLPIFHKIYRYYENELEKNQVVDFDDLIFKTYLLLKENEDIVEKLQNRWWHVLVDEFQDTNLSQFELIQLLCPPDIL